MSIWGFFDDDGKVQQSLTIKPYGLFCKIGDDCEFENCICVGICVECDKLSGIDCECNDDDEWVHQLKLRDEIEEFNFYNDIIEI